MLPGLLSVLGGLSPEVRPAPPRSQTGFGPEASLATLERVAVDATGGVWAVGDGGLVELATGRLVAPAGGVGSRSLSHLAVAEPVVVVVGGSGGLYVLEGDRLDPVEPRERVLGLCSHGRDVLALVEGPGGEARLRRWSSASGPWHEIWRGGPGFRVLAVGADGAAWIGGAGVVRVDPRGGAREAVGPEPGWRVLGLAVGASGGLLEEVGEEGGTRLRRFGPGPGAGRELAGRRPGRTAGGLAWVGEGGLVEEAGGAPAAPPRALPEGVGERGEVVQVLGGPRGEPLVASSRGLWEGTRRGWRPLLSAGLVPTSVMRFAATRGGALWALSGQGGLFHQNPDGIWTGIELPDAWRMDTRLSAADGESLLVRFESGSGEVLARIAPPRLEEQGDRVVREPKVLETGGLEAREVGALAALGPAVFLGLGPRLVRIQGKRVETWGTGEGLPGGSIVGLATLFDDLWVLVQGAGGPVRLGRGVPPIERPVAGGPAGEARIMAVDERSGQLWVGFADGAKGAAASLNREGLWISQLRLGAPVDALAADSGAVLAGTSEGLYALTAGERIRKLYGEDDGLVGGRIRALALARGTGLVGTEVGLFRSRSLRFGPEEAEASGLRV